MCDRQRDCNSEKSSTVPVLLPKKYIPLMWLLAVTLASIFPIPLCTVTSLAKPFGILMFGLLFVGKPVPLQVTVAPESAQPAMFKLAGLTVIPPACRSAITLGIL